MSIIKSFSVGDGDMFYIDHNSDNFSIIDCHLDKKVDGAILDEIYQLRHSNGITRFISTHPDEDHIKGLTAIDDAITIYNFYCVENSTTKEDESQDFKRYQQLHSSSKAFYLYKGCSRYWMNKSNEKRDTAGINILWPVLDNKYSKNALSEAAQGGSPNNISPVIQYSANGMKALWMGDLESEFMENIEDDLEVGKVDLLFAPHHGRASGKIPKAILETLDPEIIIIGEAPSDHLNYYKGYNTITQNTAGDIVFDCLTGKVRIYTGNWYKANFLEQEFYCQLDGFYYIGTLYV